MRQEPHLEPRGPLRTEIELLNEAQLALMRRAALPSAAWVERYAERFAELWTKSTADAYEADPDGVLADLQKKLYD